MKRIRLLSTIIAFALLFLVTLVGASLTLASDDDFGGGRITFSERLEELREQRSARLEELREKRDEKIGELREKRAELKERIATRQAELRLRVIERIKKVFSKILARLEAALARLDKIEQRIATRIDKLKDKGVDTIAAEQQLEEAESMGAAAAQAIDDAQAAIDAIDPESSTVRDGVHAARDAQRGAKQALKNYHKALVEAIRELKAARELREATEDAD